GPELGIAGLGLSLSAPPRWSSEPSLLPPHRGYAWRLHRAGRRSLRSFLPTAATPGGSTALVVGTAATPGGSTALVVGAHRLSRPSARPAAVAAWPRRRSPRRRSARADPCRDRDRRWSARPGACDGSPACSGCDAPRPPAAACGRRA